MPAEDGIFSLFICRKISLVLSECWGQEPVYDRSIGALAIFSTSLFGCKTKIGHTMYLNKWFDFGCFYFGLIVQL